MTSRLSAEGVVQLPLIEYPVASPSTRYVAFFSNENGPRSLFVYDRTNDSYRQLTENFPEVPPGDLDKFDFCWGLPGDCLYLNHSDSFGIDVVDLAGNVSSAQPSDQPIRPHDVRSQDGAILCSMEDNSLAVVEEVTETDERIRRVSPRAISIDVRTGVAFSGDGKYIAAQRKPADGDSTPDFLIVTTKTGSVEYHAVDDAHGRVVFEGWHPDKPRILFTDYGKTPRTGIYDLNEESATWVGKGVAVEALPDGSGCLVLRNHTPVSSFFDGTERVVQLNGTCTAFQSPASSLFIDETTFVIRRKSRDRPFELYECDIDTGSACRIVEIDLSDLSEADRTPPDRLTYPGHDAEEFEVLRWEGERSPASTVVNVYGAHQNTSPLFNRRSIAFRRLGYHVLRPQHGERPYHPNHDFVELAGWLEQQSWATDTRVLFGHSHGGFDVLMQMSHWPERWTAGIAWNGTTDLLENPDDQFVQRHLGSPAEHHGRWETNSPITHVERVQGPLLLLYGTDDPNYEQGRRFYEALPQNRKESVEFVSLEGQGHFPHHREQQAAVMKRIRNFLSDIRYQSSDPN